MRVYDIKISGFGLLDIPVEIIYMYVYTYMSLGFQGEVSVADRHLEWICRWSLRL